MADTKGGTTYLFKCFFTCLFIRDEQLSVTGFDPVVGDAASGAAALSAEQFIAIVIPHVLFGFSTLCKGEGRASFRNEKGVPVRPQSKASSFVGEPRSTLLSVGAGRNGYEPPNTRIAILVF